MMSSELLHRYHGFKLFLVFFIVLPILITAAADECGTDGTSQAGVVANKPEALEWKLVAFASILVFGAIGVCLHPVLGKCHKSLHPDGNIFLVIKAFAGGVILATGFIHILPDANENLTSPCLSKHPWGDLPFAYVIAMMAAIGTLIIDCYASRYYTSKSSEETGKLDEDKGNVGDHGHGSDNVILPVHTHATHGHSHGAIVVNGYTELIRHRIISQVLEVGIVVHSVIIGISLGVSPDPSEIKPLAIALTFHQFFEGMGLGGCLSQAKHNVKSLIWMVLFFALTTPVGIGVGIAISNTYNANSPTALIVGGILNAIASGILIYMSLVDLLAADFMNGKLQNTGKLQLATSIGALIFGAGCMTVLAIWA